MRFNLKEPLSYYRFASPPKQIIASISDFRIEDVKFEIAEFRIVRSERVSDELIKAYYEEF